MPRSGRQHWRAQSSNRSLPRMRHTSAAGVRGDPPASGDPANMPRTDLCWTAAACGSRHERLGGTPPAEPLRRSGERLVFATVLHASSITVGDAERHATVRTCSAREPSRQADAGCETDGRAPAFGRRYSRRPIAATWFERSSSFLGYWGHQSPEERLIFEVVSQKFVCP